VIPAQRNRAPPCEIPADAAFFVRLKIRLKVFTHPLAPGEVVTFKVALKDDAKQVKFVKVLPNGTP
jgi:hypothetical protein